MDNDNGVKVEDIFTECDSPSLIELYSSCVLKVRFCYYLIGGKTGHLYSEIMQIFDFRPMKIDIMFLVPARMGLSAARKFFIIHYF